MVRLENIIFYNVAHHKSLIRIYTKNVCQANPVATSLLRKIENKIINFKLQ